MHRVVESKTVYIGACAAVLFAMAMCFFTGHWFLAIGSGILPPPENVVNISQSPFPPPPPDQPWDVALKQSPFPPPPPDQPWDVA